VLLRIPNKFSCICSFDSIFAFSYISTRCLFCLMNIDLNLLLSAVTSNIDIVYRIRFDTLSNKNRSHSLSSCNHISFLFSFIHTLVVFSPSFFSAYIEEKDKKFLIFISLSINSENFNSLTNIKQRQKKRRKF